MMQMEQMPLFPSLQKSTAEICRICGICGPLRLWGQHERPFITARLSYVA
jgi:hypothetical protein